MTVLSCVNPLSAAPLSCISINNQKCKLRPEIIDVNNDDPVFYLFSIKTSKYSGSCNNINDPYTNICVPDVIKNSNLKIFNLMSRTNKTRQIKWHETGKCKFRLDASVYNNKQRWNNDKCWCECKELIDKGVCDKGYIWHPSNCDWFDKSISEYDKSYDVREYLDYKSFKCRKRSADRLVEQCAETVKEVKIAGKNEHKIKCSSCILYIVLFSIFFAIRINAYFVYYKYMNCNKESTSRYDYVYQTTI